MEIIAKFGSAMSGFWWALDERERMILVGTIGYLIFSLAAIRIKNDVREREMNELADLVAERINRG